MFELLISHLELGSAPEIALPSASRPAVVLEVEMMPGAASRQLIGAGFEIVAVDETSWTDYTTALHCLAPQLATGKSRDHCATAEAMSSFVER